MLALFLKTISNILELREFGVGLCKTVVKTDSLKLIDRGISATKNKTHLISPCIRLLTEIVSFDGGALARQVWLARETTFKRLEFYLTLRPPPSDDPQEDREKPSVRYNAVRFLTANLTFQSQATKADILCNRSLTNPLLEDLKGDSAEVLSELILVIEKQVVNDKSLSRSSKMRFFSDRNLARLAVLYRYEADAGLEDHSKSIKSLMHRLLQDVCTDSERGILIPDSSWNPVGGNLGVKDFNLPKDSDVIDLGLDNIDLSRLSMSKTSVRNHTLSSFIQGLKPESDRLQSQLILDIFKAAPELVADYFYKRKYVPSDPKPTPVWLGYSAFLFSTVQLPVPERSGEHELPARPPPVLIAMESILPQPLDQKALSRCLTQSNEVVTLFAIRYTTVAFQKLQKVLEVFSSRQSESDDIWEQACSQLVAEFCRRCPKMKDVIATFRSTKEEDRQQRAATAELLSMYYRLVPDIALDEKFDVSVALGKALGYVQSSEETADNATSSELQALLDIAQRSPDMRWWHKPGKMSWYFLEYWIVTYCSQSP